MTAARIDVDLSAYPLSSSSKYLLCTSSSVDAGALFKSTSLQTVVDQPLVISTGDPAGVGPLVSVQAAITFKDRERQWLIGDAEYLQKLIDNQLDSNVVTQTMDVTDAFEEGVLVSEIRKPADLSPGVIGLIHVGHWPTEMMDGHAPCAQGGQFQRMALDVGRSLCQQRLARALVTAPVSKAAVEMSGVHFSGQTEYLAEACSLKADEVTMLFLGPRLCTGLVTTHAAIRDVADLIQVDRVERATLHLCAALEQLAKKRGTTEKVLIAVAALNPHAGESGLFGDEDPRIVQVGMDRARQRIENEFSSIEIVGLVPAETAFRKAAEGVYGGVVAMYHDQATIASKILDWGKAVNVTWGLPFVRTSVDHGVAYDAAALDQADAGGMVHAIEMARALTF